MEEACAATDAAWMRRAIALGRAALGRTGDNPNVGAVVVSGRQLLGEGSTQPPYQPHAEVAAFLDAEARGNDVAGATLYTTLEPCCFQGRTPPCTEAILARGISRVVLGIRDPHVRVDGRGVERLRQAGLSLTEGVCAAEVEAYLSVWLARVRRNG